MGFEAAALLGGFDAWKAEYPTEPEKEETPA
jgi:rhodanese-related sulfurtransferase